MCVHIRDMLRNSDPCGFRLGVSGRRWINTMGPQIVSLLLGVPLSEPPMSAMSAQAPEGFEATPAGTWRRGFQERKRGSSHGAPRWPSCRRRARGPAGPACRWSPRGDTPLVKRYSRPPGAGPLASGDERAVTAGWVTRTGRGRPRRGGAPPVPHRRSPRRWWVPRRSRRSRGPRRPRGRGVP